MKSIGPNKNNTCFIIKHIGTNEKAFVLIRKAYEPTKQMFYCENDTNQQQSNGLTLKKHRNQ